MSYSNGLLPDQSYQTANKYVQRGLPGVGFKLTVRETMTCKIKN